MSDRLTDLQSKLSADERFLDHRDLHELCRLQQAVIERMRNQLNDTVSIETVLATEAERDEAREAACDLWSALLSLLDVDIADLTCSWAERYPWLEDVEEVTDE
jgi:hypothetical protein